MCEWKRNNAEVLRILKVRLYPSQLQVKLLPNVFAFLGPEAFHITELTPRTHFALIAPTLKDKMFVAHALQWYSILLTGIKAACCWFAHLRFPLVTPRTSEGDEREVGDGMSSLAHDRWAVFERLCRNYHR